MSSQNGVGVAHVHKGIKIWINPDGIYLCAMSEINNGDWRSKTFHSEKIPSICKAIDAFLATDEEAVKDKMVWIARNYFPFMRRKQIKTRVGARTFYTDGKDSTVIDHRSVFPLSIENNAHFIKAQQLYEEYKKINKELNILRVKQKDLSTEYHIELNKISRLRKDVTTMNFNADTKD